MITANIRELEANACTAFLEYGYSERTIKPKLFIIRALTHLHIEQGREQFDVGIAEDYIRHHETRYKNQEICRDVFLFYKKTTECLVQICDGGTIIKKRNTPTPVLPECFEYILSSMFATKKWAPRFGKSKYRLIRGFFQWLSSRGHIDFSRVNGRVVSEYLTECSKRMVGSSLYNERQTVKDVLMFISEDGTLSETMNKLFLFRIPIGKKVKTFIPQDEIADILNIVDRNTMCGKRNYAIILLATVTGLRGIDIVNLTMNSIDWINGEIRIIQEKTGNALALPLTTGAGIAIREYVLEARPHSKSDKIFVNSHAPFGKMKPTSLNHFLKKYCLMVGLHTQHTFHSLRRSLATNMVTSGVSVITVAQALGHNKIDSTKQYISLDSKNLKECALDFSGIQVNGGGFL